MKTFFVFGFAVSIERVKRYKVELGFDVERDYIFFEDFDRLRTAKRYAMDRARDNAFQNPGEEVFARVVDRKTGKEYGPIHALEGEDVIRTLTVSEFV